MDYEGHAPCCTDYIDECHYKQGGDNRLGFMKELGISWSMFAGGIIAIVVVIFASVLLTRCSLNKASGDTDKRTVTMAKVKTNIGAKCTN